jgi:hypothetical protein
VVATTSRTVSLILISAGIALVDTLSAVRAQVSTPPDANVERRIVNSPGVTVQAPGGKLALGSFHLEVNAKQPRLDADKKRVVAEEWKLVADLERDNVSVACTVKGPTSGPADTIQGWIIGEGRPGGVPYETAGGTLAVSPRVQHQCWARSYAWTPALSVAASGHTIAGQETIDGRLADKYQLQAHPQALDRIRPMMNLTSARGTVWLDQRTGALLKAIIEYTENFTESRGSDKVVGRGDGRVEIMVTRVGKVKIQLPK